MFLNKIKNIHFIGIGGIGMSSIAEILLANGFNISGSDINSSAITTHLQKLGATIFIGHAGRNIKKVDLVVRSSAINVDNPEVIEAKKRGITVIKRSKILAELMRLKYGIGIAGTHGKTTTTTMVGLALIEGGLDPAIIVGGQSNNFDGTNAYAGKGDYVVVEADEYDRTFLELQPVINVITTLELEHLDTYKNFEGEKTAFIEFANKVPFYGFVLLCADEKNVMDLIPFIKSKVITYGLNRNSHIRAIDVKYHQMSSSFTVLFKGENLGRINLNLPGVHNIKNALPAIGIAKELGVEFNKIKKALESFKGVRRRFEVKYNKEILVIDDYAHHPTEVEAALSAVHKGWKRRLIVVFQPHLYSRTKDFYKEFANAFLKTDIFICTDIFPAREKPIKNISGELIANEAKNLGHPNVIYEKDKRNITKVLKNIVKSGDIIITMGAGDIWKYGDEFIQQLKMKD